MKQITNLIPAFRTGTESATTFEEWSAAARQYDVRNGFESWRAKNATPLYDYVAITRRLSKLRALRQSGDDKSLMYTLNEGIHGNIDGIGNARLYSKAKFGTKHLIEDYVSEVTSALRYLADNPTPSIKPREKFEFFQRASHCFGRSGLLLSGAGTLLYFHYGVLKALAENDLIPNVISGSSGGAFAAAFIGTRTRAQFLADINNPNLASNTIDEKEFAWYEHIVGRTVTQRDALDKLAELIPDLTFQEAYEVSGLQINISVSPSERHQKPRLLSAPTSPNAMVREAVLASCAVPGIFPSVALAAKDENGERVEYLRGSRWLDGSLTGDLPVKRLARLYGVNHTIVSQTNPLVLPFVDADKDPSGLVDVTRQAGLSVIKNISLASSRILRGPISITKMGQTMVNGFISLASQSYTGDITILPREKVAAYNPLKWLSEKSISQVEALIRGGERATWPVIKRIKNQTMISRELDRIILQYENKNWSEKKSNTKKKVSKRK